MSTGYGRGYYGNAQLEQPRRRSGRGWLAVAAVAGLGAVIWFMLPSLGPRSHDKDEASPSREELEQLARSRGFSSVAALEEAVIASARELQATGARVELSPSLKHLETRLGREDHVGEDLIG